MRWTGFKGSFQTSLGRRTARWGLVDRPVKASAPSSWSAISPEDPLASFWKRHGDYQLVETPVKAALDHAVNMIARSASSDEDEFDLLTNTVDERVLIPLTAFLRVLDEAGATIRVVGETREFSLDRAAVERARKRMDGIEITQTIEQPSGRLYILPTMKRFEMHSEEVGGGTISGDVHPECVRRIAGENYQLPLGFSDDERSTKIRHRIIKQRNRAERHTYTLLDVG